MRERAKANRMQTDERRGTPRLQVLGRIQGRLLSLPLPVELRDLGPSGFSVESPLPFPLGARRLFLFTTAGGLQVLIEGAAAHCRHDDEAARYVTGFRFMHSRLTDTTADIGVLLDAMSGLADLEVDLKDGSIG
jgi:hypothetical protein